MSCSWSNEVTDKSRDARDDVSVAAAESIEEVIEAHSSDWVTPGGVVEPPPSGCSGVGIRPMGLGTPGTRAGAGASAGSSKRSNSSRPGSNIKL
jgi:hypothetical protein